MRTRFFVACCMALLAGPALSQRSSSPAAAPAPTASGRYTIIHSPHLEKDTVLLDTVTGKTWILVEDTSRNAFFWSPLARKDNDAEIQNWLNDHPAKADQSNRR